MQRQLHQSLRLLFRQQCRCRSYSARAATAVQAVRPLPETSSSPEPAGPSKVSKQDINPEHPETKPKPKKKRRGERLLQETDFGISPEGAEALLASMRVEGFEPTLDDLLTLEPKEMLSSTSNKYAETYMELRNRLCRSFSKTQLQRFAEELKLRHALLNKSQRKTEYAELIMEKHWGWESLKDIERKTRDMTEVTKNTLPLSAAEIFLLLGKDGSRLLQISKDYNVHISVNPKPLALNIEGFRGSVRKLSAMIVERRASVVNKIVDLPTGKPLSISLLRQISRNADTFIENAGFKGTIRIYSDDVDKLNVAERILVRAALEVRRLEEMPFVALLPNSAEQTVNMSDKYALFPFVQQYELPWTSASGDVFRSRKITSWFPVELAEDPVGLSFESPGSKGMTVDLAGNEKTLEDIVKESFGDSYDTCVFSASTGHILVMRHSTHRSILPPLSGRWHYQDFMAWMKNEKVQRVFVPSLPEPLRDTPPTEERIVHRLVYRRLPKNFKEQEAGSALLPTDIIQAEVTISRAQPKKAVIESTGDLKAQSELDDLLIDDQLDVLIAKETERSAIRDSSKPEEESAVSSAALNSTAPVESKDLPSNTDSNAGQRTSDIEEDETFAHTGVDALHDDGEDIDFRSDPQASQDEAPGVILDSQPTFTRSRMLDLLMALPDRPTDLKLSVSSSPESVALSELPRLEAYFSDLKAFLEPDRSDVDIEPPEAPLFLVDNNDTFVLASNLSVRQSTELLKTTRVEMDNELTSHDIATTTESVFDLETRHKAVHCEVKCQGLKDTRKWASYLNDLDEVTSRGYQPPQANTGSRFNADEDESVSPPPEYIL